MSRTELRFDFDALTAKRALKTFFLSLLVLTLLIILSKVDDQSGMDWPMLALGVLYGAVALGLMAAIPAFVSFSLLWLLLQIPPTTLRFRAVIASGMAACCTTYALSYLLREFSGGFGVTADWPKVWQVIVVAAVTMAAAFLIWTISREGREAT